MKRAIVTGASGFLGRWLVKELIKQNISVTAVVRPNTKNLALLDQNSKITIVQCDLLKYHELTRCIAKEPETVFYHLAWRGVSGTERMDFTIQANNISASLTAVEAAAQLECVRFVGMGSIMEKEALAVTNTDAIKPAMSYLYGEAKQFAHLVTKAKSAELGIAHIWPLLTNAYGEGEFSPRFLNTTLRKILNDEPLEFTSGTQIYDFIHVEDAARALVLLGDHGKSFCDYIIGSGTAAPLRTFVERIGKMFAPNKVLRFGDVPYSGANLSFEDFSNEKLAHDTGFVPIVPFEEGLMRTMAWLKEVEQ